MCLYFLVLLCSVVTYFGFKFCANYHSLTESQLTTGWHSHAQHHRKDAHVPANPHVWRRYQEMSCYATRAEQGCRRAWTQQCVCLVCMFLTRLSEWDSMRVLDIVDSVAILTRWVTNIDRRAFCFAITLIICVFFFFFRAHARYAESKP